MTEYATFEDMVKADNFVILDTETTGLSYPAEIVSIGILSKNGETLLDTLVKPKNPIPADATRIHGITNADVANASSWASVRTQVAELIRGRDLIIYNADYDISMLYSTDRVAGIEAADWSAIPNTVYCAMYWYADLWGEWDDYHGNNRWQRLTTAIRQQGLSVADAHHALGDCKMTLALIRKLIT
jgi:DNA polymerase III epsilon subunit-like protein